MNRNHPSHGFSLVELLIVMAIIGLLVVISLPAVQRSRESARRASCQNQLRNQAIGLLHYHDARREFPAGQYAVRKVNHSWCTFVLPYLEETALFRSFDLAQPWNSPRNAPVANHTVPTFACPSSETEFPGKSDYTGVCGTAWSPGLRFHQAFRSGILIRISQRQQQPVRLKDVTDGVGKTLIVTESAERTADEHGRWADGLQLVSHNSGPINSAKGEIYSVHPGGAYAAFADGSAVFLSDSTDPTIVGAFCTRSAGEVVASSR